MIQELQDAGLQAADSGSSVVKTLPHNPTLPEGEPPPPIAEDYEVVEGGSLRESGGYRDFDTGAANKLKNSSTKSSIFGGAKKASGGGISGFFSGVGKSIGSLFGADEEDPLQMALPQDPLPPCLTVVDSDGNRCKSWDPSKRLVLPLSSASVMQECSGMESYLEQMNSNLECLSSDYDTYLNAVRAVAKASEQLTATVFCFAGVSPAAKLFFQLIAQASNQKVELEQSQAHLETAIGSFWTSDDAVHLRDGTLKKMLNDASTTYNVSLARALANTKPDKYESALEGSQGVKTAVAKLNVQRWDYVSTLEALTQQRELEMNQLFMRFVEAQTTVVESQYQQHQELKGVIDLARTSMNDKVQESQQFCGAGGAQQQYRTRLVLAIDRVQQGGNIPLPGVCDADLLVEGLVFMCPAVVRNQEKVRKQGKAKRPTWLPTWATLDLASGVFHFDAEWQGPVPGMDSTLRDAYALSASMPLNSCIINGFDASTPVGGLGASTGRMFLFEVQSLDEGFSEPTVYLFQALSPKDMNMWASGFERAGQANTCSASPRISLPSVEAMPRSQDVLLPVEEDKL